MRYFSDEDVIRFADSLGFPTDIATLDAWAVTDAEDPIYEAGVLEEQSLKLHLVDQLLVKGDSTDPETIKNAAQELYDFITTTTAAAPGEDVIRVTTLNYTVLTANGMLQNLIYEFAGGDGDFTLPTDEEADGLTLYISNTTGGDITFSESIYFNNTTSATDFSAFYLKITYSHADNKWFLISQVASGA